MYPGAHLVRARFDTQPAPADDPLVADQEPQGVEVPVAWVGVDDLPILAANQFVIGHNAPEEFILVIGQIALPIVLGSNEEKLEQLRMLSFAPIKPIVRVMMSRQRLEELRDVLNRHIDQVDAQLRDAGAPDE